MAPRRDEDDFLEEEWLPRDDDGDGDDWDDEGEDEDDELFRCPECGEMIHVESERCPECGHYITEEAAPSRIWSSRPWWWLLLGGLGIAAVIYALTRT